MMRRMVLLAIAASVSSCGGGSTVAGPGSSAVDKVEGEGREKDASQAPAVENTGGCTRVGSWSAAEAWMSAFRLPAAKAPSKGGEKPSVHLRRLESEHESLRAYEQKAAYPLAQRIVNRRFVFDELEGGAVTGCLVWEEARTNDEADLTWRFSTVQEGAIELSDRKAGTKPAADKVHAALSRLAGQTRYQHVCQVIEGMMSCASITNAGAGGATVSVQDGWLRYKLEPTLALFNHAGPYRIPIQRACQLGARTSTPSRSDSFYP